MLFAVLSVAAFICLLSSFYFGGRGIAELYKAGYDGNWIIQTKGRKFNKQTFLALVGTGLLLASIFCGKPKEDDTRKQLLSAQGDITSTKQRLDAAEAEIAKLKSVISTQETSAQSSLKPGQGDKKNGHSDRKTAGHPHQ